MTDAQAKAQSTEAAEDRVLRITRTFDAPPARVFAAWTDPKRLVQWWGPEGVTIPDCKMDVRQGGAWHTVMRNSDGTENHVSGVYHEISPPDRLVFTWAWTRDGKRGHETVVSIDFIEKAGKTEMQFQQRLFEDNGDRDAHNGGWESSFRCLDAYLAGDA